MLIKYWRGDAAQPDTAAKARTAGYGGVSAVVRQADSSLLDQFPLPTTVSAAYAGVRDACRGARVTSDWAASA